MRIERHEHRAPAPVEHVEEDRPPLLVEADELPVEHGLVAGELAADRLPQPRPGPIGLAASRDELRLPVSDVCARPEPVVLQLEEPIRVVERLGPAAELEWREPRERGAHAGENIPRA